VDHDGIVRQTARGVLYAASGQVFLLLLGLVGGVLLARLLSPKDFGIYAVTSFVVLQLGAFAELGLNTKLIHQDESPSLTEQHSVFTLHFFIALCAFSTLCAAAPLVAPLFKLDGAAINFIRLVGFIILMQPFQTVPAAVLNRGLRYDCLTLADVVNGLVYQLIAVILAFLGFSYWSFGAAAVLAYMARISVLSYFCPWKIGLAWDPSYLRRCVRFGGTFQLSSFTALARDNIITFLAGPLFGPTAVGFLNWALRLAWVCTQTFVGVCARISFPSLSRMRSEPALFRSAITKMLRYVNLCTFCTLSVVSGLAPETVRLVYTNKWAPAIPLFYLFAIRMVLGNYTTLFDLALKAQGSPERSLTISSAWTILEWIVALVALDFFGYTGIAISAAACIWFAVVWLYREVALLSAADLWRASATPALCGAVTFLTLYWGKGERIQGLPGLLVGGLCGLVLYLGTALVVERRDFWTELSQDIGAVVGRKAARTPLLVRVASAGYEGGSTALCVTNCE
jgi:O-antigen/teichoic acid export membrane protein